MKCPVVDCHFSTQFYIKLEVLFVVIENLDKTENMEGEDIKPFSMIPEEELMRSAQQLNYSDPSVSGFVQSPFRKSRTKINDELRKEIVTFYVQYPYMNQGQIADMFGIDRTTVSKLLKRKHEYLDPEVEELAKKIKADNENQVQNLVKDSASRFQQLATPSNSQSIIKSARKGNKSGQKQNALKTSASYGLQAHQRQYPERSKKFSEEHASMLQANHWALQRQLLNKMTGQPATKTPKLAHIVSNHGDRLVKKLAVKKVPVVPNFLHKGPPTSSSVGHLKWVTEGIRVKEEPEVIEIDDNTDTGIGLTYDQSDEGLSCTDMEKEQALIKKYFNLPSNQDVALSDEQLLQCYLVGKSAAENFISGLHRQENAKKQQRHKPVSETVTSNTALDPSMSLKVATQSQGTSQLSSHRIPKEKAKERTASSTGDSDQMSSSQESKEKDRVSDVVVKQEIPDASELDDTEALSRDMKSLEKFREQQQAIEEANKQKKALLSKTLTERRKKAKAEAHKLEHIQRELAKLDHLLTADVQVIRDKIEGASRDFLEAQKRFQKVEAEYVEAKMDLHNTSELKEQLTEHLYTIIHQNEMRKAKKLAELMKELEMDSTEEEFQLPELPPLSSFQPVHAGPLSPGKSHISPVKENGPADFKTKTIDDAGDNKVVLDKNSSDKIIQSAENSLKQGDKNPVSEMTSESSNETSADQPISQNIHTEISVEQTESAQSEQRTTENKTPESSGETESPKGENSCKVNSENSSTVGDNSEVVDRNSTKDIPSGIKVGQVSQYVKDRKAQVREELETVQNLIKETESDGTKLTDIEQGVEVKKPTSWDFSGEVNSIVSTNKS